MTTRTARTTVTFTRRFAFDGIEGEHPPGTYDVDTDEELIEDLSFLAWRRVATAIHLPKGGAMQMHRIDPAELDANLAADAADERNGVSAARSNRT